MQHKIWATCLVHAPSYHTEYVLLADFWRMAKNKLRDLPYPGTVCWESNCGSIISIDSSLLYLFTLQIHQSIRNTLTLVSLILYVMTAVQFTIIISIIEMSTMLVVGGGGRKMENCCYKRILFLNDWIILHDLNYYFNHRTFPFDWCQVQVAG